MSQRTSGILLHVTSFPSPFGIGDLGPGAYRFIDFLQAAGQSVWQVLPLVPVGLGDSPYSSPSTFAGNPHLISPEQLVRDGWLEASDLNDAPTFGANAVDFEHAGPFKETLLTRAYDKFRSASRSAGHTRFQSFCDRHADWLDDYALFMAIKEAMPAETPWTEWPADLATRKPQALEAARRDYTEAIERRKFWQFLFDEQWHAIKEYAHARGVRILGDVPIYVAHDSADVWAHPELFDLDNSGVPQRVAGVPPDYFSETGQRWGNPLYKWDEMEARGFAWWKRRLQRTLEWVDVVRLDHFRGFEAYWAIPAEEETAVNGEWVDGPGEAIFDALIDEFGSPLPLVAEDLGLITPEVTALKDRYKMPGMAILLFGFGGDAENVYLPHNYERNLVAYTGTHDNNTFVGWWKESASDEEREHARTYLGLDDGGEEHLAAIRMLMASRADSVIVPLQDVLGLGSEGRMNTPGVETGNWTWRYTEPDLTVVLANRLRRLTEAFGRAPTGYGR